VHLLPNFIAKHIDSCVFISAFMPDEEDHQAGLDVVARSFLIQIVDHEPNSRLRMSLPAWGEVLLRHLKSKADDPTQAGMQTLKEFFRTSGQKLEPFSPKLRGTPENLNNVLGSVKDCCEEMKNSHADTQIVAYAMVDPDASNLYTTDNHLLTCTRLRNVIRDFREDQNLRRLRIGPVE